MKFNTIGNKIIKKLDLENYSILKDCELVYRPSKYIKNLVSKKLPKLFEHGYKIKEIIKVIENEEISNVKRMHEVLIIYEDILKHILRYYKLEKNKKIAFEKRKKEVN